MTDDHRNVWRYTVRDYGAKNIPWDYRVYDILTNASRETYANIFNTLSMVESALNGKRYWIDILGRPRRSPLARPLLHKGRKGKKHG